MRVVRYQGRRRRQRCYRDTNWGWERDPVEGGVYTRKGGSARRVRAEEADGEVERGGAEGDEEEEEEVLEDEGLGA
jgi:hypothetical protein